MDTSPRTPHIPGFGNLPLKFEAHARVRMAQRKVSEADVTSVLDAPDWGAPAARPGARKFVRYLGGRTLTVIVELKPTFVRVVTVYWRDPDEDQDSGQIG